MEPAATESYDDANAAVERQKLGGIRETQMRRRGEAVQGVTRARFASVQRHQAIER